MAVIWFGDVWRSLPMSLHPGEIPPVPEVTRRVAQAAFPRGNLYMRLRDELGTIYDDHLLPPYSQPGGSRRRRPGASR